SSRRRHTRSYGDWSSDVCSSDLELLEWGYRRGVAYDLVQLSYLGTTSDKWLVNPVDAPPSACQASHGSASFTAPFLCQGNSGVRSEERRVGKSVEGEGRRETKRT